MKDTKKTVNDCEVVVVSKALLLRLLSSDAKLTALESMGVDNWSGCETAYQEFCEEHDVVSYKEWAELTIDSHIL